MQRILAFTFLFFTYFGVSAQQFTVEQYIDMYKDIAIREMKRMGIPASITLAQGILETENGNGDLVKKSNNHFGIKCKSSWSGSSVSHDDDANGECFRKYNTAEDSYRDHSNFLRGNDRYAFLFKLSPTDYRGWAYGLKKAGYATNPSYPEILIKYIEDYNLQQYCLGSEKEVPVFDGSKYVDDKEETVTIVTTTKDNTAPATPTISTDKTMFNNVKAVFATAGTSLLAIATDHHIALAKLLEFNDLTDDGLLEEDSWVFLERKQAQGNRDFYITDKQENINNIAQQNAIQLSTLLKYNDLKENEIVKAGTKIYLRPSSNKNETTNTTTSIVKTSLKYYEVQPKEGLYAISRKFNVSVQELRIWNNLSSDDLKIGQKLIISK